METEIDVLIIGGGLAGLTSAIHLSKAGIRVLLIEKNSYPHHKVCGEYVSNEVLPYLQSLDADPGILSPTNISRFQFTSTSGKCIETSLPLGGFGISRLAFDEFLYKKAKENGCLVIHDTVTDVVFNKESFNVSTLNSTYKSKMVLGAYGKRAAIDHKLERKFIAKKSPWLAIKAHYHGDFPNDLVALHNFPNGYCGVSKVENNLINICYLVEYRSFQQYKDIAEHQKKVLYQNAYLKDILENSEMHFKAPITISQVSFANKEKVNRHILMIGDTTGLIHPMCGNGMAMAIHSAQICSALLINYFGGKIQSRALLEYQYERQWNTNFKSRIRMGKLLAAILKQEKYADFLINGLMKFPGVLPLVIKKTHGKPLIIE